ncbi:cytochrome c oxidase assembly protein (plasmid) [Phyllobacterium sp. K27]
MALLVVCYHGKMGSAARFLAIATIVQVVAIWALHTPVVLNFAFSDHALHLFMQLSLFVLALWFWLAVFATTGNERWKPVVALLLTSKLFCLLGILLLFSPRPLYTSSHHAVLLTASLQDQQMAGLLMLIACSLTYVLAGIVVSGRWLFSVDGEDRASGVRHA